MILYHTNVLYDNIVDKFEFECSRAKVKVTLDIFSSPGRSPGRAIVLPPASASASALALAAAAAAALAKSLTLIFLCDGQGAVRRPVTGLVRKTLSLL